MDTSADVLQLIEEAYKTFSKGQRYIADYICNNYDKAVDMTAATLERLSESVNRRLFDLQQSLALKDIRSSRRHWENL